MKAAKQLIQRLGQYFRLLTYAEPCLQDIILLIVGTTTAVASGIPFPILGILFGQLVDDVNSASCAASSISGIAAPSYQSDVSGKILTVVYIGIANLVLIYVYIVSWNLFGERLAQRMREKYLRSLLHQDMSFFDQLSPGEVSSHLNADIAAIQQGTSEKVGIVLNAISFFVAAYVIAFIKDASLAGMLVSLTPAFLIMSLAGGYFIGKYAKRMSTKIASASSMALEAISNVMIVHAFGANARLETQFADIVTGARSAGICKAFAASVQSGLLYFIAYSANALAYWQGSEKIASSVAAGNASTTVGTIYTAIFILVDATIILSTVAPYLHVFGSAQSAFEKLEEGIAPQGSIDVIEQRDETLSVASPSISFANVTFAYPSRPENAVLSGVSLDFQAGRHTAIVGLSGSGKSTIANLLMRLYDPTKGTVFLGEQNMKEIGSSSLRCHISLVQQEPTLFNCSILENIAFGLLNSRKHKHLKATLLSGILEEVSQKALHGIEISDHFHGYSKEVIELLQLIQQAAKLADAHKFISGLKCGYGTVVGAKGALISGGQKQRICIARALVKDPNILILDEATAALDSTSERRIHAALTQASRGRTTISIAHRLSSIKMADNIIVMNAGRVVEQGRHAELMSHGSAYAELVKLQQNNEQASSPTESESYSSAESVLFHDEQSEKAMPVIESMNASASSQSDNGHQYSQLDQKHDPDIDHKQPLSAILRTVRPLFRPELLVLLVAFAAVIVVGGTYSAAAVIFGNTIGALSPCHSASSIRSAGSFFALMFFVLAMAEFFANVISWSGFGYVAERILHKFRVLSFKSLLEQDLQWHEHEGRTPSASLALLTSDVNAIGALTGSTVGTIFSILVNLVAAIVLTHILAWKIALVCLAVLPLILGAGTMQLVVLTRFAARHQEAFTHSVGIAVEAVEMVRTVKSFCLQENVMQAYRLSLREPTREMTHRSLYANMWLALAYGLPNFVYAFAYWWGIKLVTVGDYSQSQFFIVLVALLVSSQLWGQLFTLAPDVSKAFTAARRVVNLIDLKSSPPILRASQKFNRENDAIPADKSNSVSLGGAGVIFRDVSFSYPARPSVQVLHGLSLQVHPGQFAALVGPSGAGKSTIIALLERMYQPDAGIITIDNTPIATASLSFRDIIAFVPQDNVLFEGSVRFNIALGARPNDSVTYEEIEEACRIANIHDTITALPQGYDTEVGTNGAQFSGGQRQRLSIARALVRKPRLLLLDESTSALDAESERILQEGLEEGRQRTGMTVVAIAHRLRTIQFADIIFYIENGRVVEQGSHEELMDKCSGYRTNAKLQGFQGL